MAAVASSAASAPDGQLLQVAAPEPAGVRVGDHGQGGDLAQGPAGVAATALGPDLLEVDDQLADVQRHAAYAIL
jgi:hypothetical protein